MTYQNLSELSNLSTDNMPTTPNTIYDIIALAILIASVAIMIIILAYFDHKKNIAMIENGLLPNSVTPKMQKSNITLHIKAEIDDDDRVRLYIDGEEIKGKKGMDKNVIRTISLNKFD